MRTEVVTKSGSIFVQGRQALTEADVIAVTEVAACLRAYHWRRRAQAFMVAQGALQSLVHVDWRQRAANEDAVDAVIGEMLTATD